MGDASALLTFADIEAALGTTAKTTYTDHSVVSLAARHWQQPGMMILELPMREIGTVSPAVASGHRFVRCAAGGQCMSWADVVKTRELCTKRNIALHLDGARLWEAQVGSYAHRIDHRPSSYCQFRRHFRTRNSSYFVHSSTPSMCHFTRVSIYLTKFLS